MRDGATRKTERRGTPSNAEHRATRTAEQRGKHGTVATAPAPRVAPVRHRPAREVPCLNDRGRYSPTSSLRSPARYAAAEFAARPMFRPGGPRRAAAARRSHHRWKAKNHGRRTRRTSSRTQVGSEESRSQDSSQVLTNSRRTRCKIGDGPQISGDPAHRKTPCRAAAVFDRWPPQPSPSARRG